MVITTHIQNKTISAVHKISTYSANRVEPNVGMGIPLVEPTVFFYIYIYFYILRKREKPRFQIYMLLQAKAKSKERGCASARELTGDVRHLPLLPSPRGNRRRRAKLARRRATSWSWRRRRDWSWAQGGCGRE
jgi:hypothetical protein